MSLLNENHEGMTLLDEEETFQVEKCVERQGYSRKWCCWTALNLVILAAFTTANATIWSSRRPVVWRTDFPDARKAIQYEERVFTGALTYDQGQGRILRLQDAETEYFGRPSLEIDQAWEELLHDEFPTMSEEEALSFSDLTPSSRDGKHHFEPDIFHSLHCLNAIRNELNPTLYNVSSEQSLWFQTHQRISELIDDPTWMIKHIEHCLDRIRQVVMCHGDLTPSPLYTWRGFPLSLGRAGTHTCRKWEPIREWMDQRARDGKSLQHLSKHNGAP